MPPIKIALKNDTETQLDKDFSKFGSKFQLITLSLLIQDKAFFNRVKDILKSGYFDNVYCKLVCEIVLEFVDAYHCQPDFETLKTIIETKEDITSTKPYLLALDNIKDADLSKKEFVETEVERFCFTRHALVKLEEEKNNILLGKFDIAKEIAFDKYKVVGNTTKEFDLKKDYKVIFEKNIRNPIPTPLESINKVTKGGPGSGDLVIIVAQSNFGKTQFVVALSRYAATIGHRCLFISLETDGIQLIQRALSGLVGVSQEHLIDHPKLIEQKVSDMKGELKFIEMKSTEAQVSNIKMKIEELKASGFFPEMIIIDGLNQVKPSHGMRFTNSNDKFEYLAEELRDMGKELQLPVICPFQLNRAGFNSEVADEQNIGKAIEVYQVADIMLMFTQSLPMQETNECYVQLLKNRLGPKGLMLKLKYDPNQGIFEEMETVQRSMLYDKKLRGEVTKGLDTMQARLEQIKKDKGINH